MKSAGAGFLAREEYRSHLDGLGAKSHGGHEATGISDASSGDNWYVDAIDDPRDERECACQGILSGAQERAPMAAGFEAGRHDRVDTSSLKCRSFVRRCRGSNRDDVLIPALVEDFARRNAVNEAKHGYVGVQKHARLIFEAHWHVGCIDGLGRS